jgi:hypothetical protein
MERRFLTTHLYSIVVEVGTDTHQISVRYVNHITTKTDTTMVLSIPSTAFVASFTWGWEGTGAPLSVTTVTHQAPSGNFLGFRSYPLPLASQPADHACFLVCQLKSLMAGLNAKQGRTLLDSGDGSDFTIECKGRSWNVHKIIMSATSDYLAQLSKGNFKVSVRSAILG